MRRILFVDDDLYALEDLRTVLRQREREWQMTFALGGVAALEALESEEYDVVISDMRMPGIDGPELLARVQERNPQAVRIVLSAQAELKSALRTASVAHVALPKPCREEDVYREVERACSVQEILREEGLRRTAAGMGELPAVPRIYSILSSTIDNPVSSASDIARILEQDPAMAAKVLQLVNSSFFGLRRKIVTVQEAVAYLGMTTLRSVVISASVFGKFTNGRTPGFSIDALQRHSFLTARIAARILRRREDAETAFTASLLHDVGKLILAAQEPTYLNEALSAASAEQRSLHAVEVDRRGSTHAETGAYLLGLWNLPLPIVEAVANHHAPERILGPELDTVAVVYIANALAHEAESELPSSGAPPTEPLDEDFVTEIGAGEHLSTWRAFARQELHDVLCTEL